MKTVQLFLLVLLYSRCESASRHKSGRKRTNSREHDIDKDSSNKRSQALTGSDSVPVECSPLPYLTTVRLGTCRRQVVTKMCYGRCESFPVDSNSRRTEETPRRKCKSSNCCSTIEKRYIPYKMKCRIKGSGRKLKKTFYLPSAESCSCTNSRTRSN